MRQGQNSKRSRGRGSGRRNNVPARHQTFDSNGPSIRIRGSANQVHEKYLTMARDAASVDDRIAAENYLQHAEHYFRIINVDNDGDGRGRGDGQRANRPQPDGKPAGDGEAAGNGEADSEETTVVVETEAQPPDNGAGAEEIGEGSEQPAVDFPTEAETEANGSTEAEAPAPRKPRGTRTPRGRGRAPRETDGADNGKGRTPPADD